MFCGFGYRKLQFKLITKLNYVVYITYGTNFVAEVYK